MKFRSDKFLIASKNLATSSNPSRNSSRSCRKMGAMNRFAHSFTTCVVSIHACVAVEVRFDDLVKNPARFNHQEVTVTGLLEVEGDSNSLWRDISARQHLDWKHWIHVVPDLNLPPYPGTNMSPDSPANLHWVKVTGIVDTSEHGLFGDKPFGLREKKVQILPGPRLKQLLPILAWFRNESDREIKMEVKFGRETAWLGIGPHLMSCTGIERGNGTAVAKTKSEKPLAQCALTPPGSRRYYDGEKHAYYYRITTNKIEPVLPSEARSWQVYSMPDRD
jgi:hypothetical protein